MSTKRCHQINSYCRFIFCILWTLGSFAYNSNCANLRHCDHFAYLVNIVHIWWTLCIYGEHFANHKYLVDCSAVCRVRRLNAEVEHGASRGLAAQTRPFVKTSFCSGSWEKNQPEIFIQAALEYLAKKSYTSTLQKKGNLPPWKTCSFRLRELKTCFRLPFNDLPQSEKKSESHQLFTFQRLRRLQRPALWSDCQTCNLVSQDLQTYNLVSQGGTCKTWSHKF